MHGIEAGFDSTSRRFEGFGTGVGFHPYGFPDDHGAAPERLSKARSIPRIKIEPARRHHGGGKYRPTRQFCECNNAKPSDPRGFGNICGQSHEFSGAQCAGHGAQRNVATALEHLFTLAARPSDAFDAEPAQDNGVNFGIAMARNQSTRRAPWRRAKGDHQVLAMPHCDYWRPFPLER